MSAPPPARPTRRTKDSIVSQDDNASVASSVDSNSAAPARPRRAAPKPEDAVSRPARAAPLTPSDSPNPGRRRVPPPPPSTGAEASAILTALSLKERENLPAEPPAVPKSRELSPSTDPLTTEQVRPAAPPPPAPDTGSSAPDLTRAGSLGELQGGSLAQITGYKSKKSGLGKITKSLGKGMKKAISSKSSDNYHISKPQNIHLVAAGSEKEKSICGGRYNFASDYWDQPPDFLRNHTQGLKLSEKQLSEFMGLLTTMSDERKKFFKSWRREVRSERKNLVDQIIGERRAKYHALEKEMQLKSGELALSMGDIDDKLKQYEAHQKARTEEIEIWTNNQIKNIWVKEKRQAQEHLEAMKSLKEGHYRLIFQAEGHALERTGGDEKQAFEKKLAKDAEASWKNLQTANGMTGKSNEEVWKDLTDRQEQQKKMLAEQLESQYQLGQKIRGGREQMFMQANQEYFESIKKVIDAIEIVDGSSATPDVLALMNK
eukprot:Clim_evm65s152 gene=Clim_evmTU65s152